jgi:hypothetical protein
LQVSNCNPSSFVDIARMSELHAEVVARNPLLNATQVHHAVGGISESLMVRFFESSGWVKAEGQVGRTGFDGLFLKLDASGQIRDVLIVESKYNSSALKSTNYGTQMSHEWVKRKVVELQAYYPNETVYRDLAAIIENDGYRARLWSMKVENRIVQIDLKSVQSKDSKVQLTFDELIERPPRIINLASPKNSFERNFCDWYANALAAYVPIPKK